MPNNNLEEILEELGEAYHNNYPDRKAHRKATQAIEQLIREARIDEIQTHRGFDMITDKPAGIVMTHKEVEDRLEQLKAGEEDETNGS